MKVECELVERKGQDAIQQRRGSKQCRAKVLYLPMLKIVTLPPQKKKLSLFLGELVPLQITMFSGKLALGWSLGKQFPPLTERPQKETGEPGFWRMMFMVTGIPLKESQLLLKHRKSGTKKEARTAHDIQKSHLVASLKISFIAL